MKTKTVRIDITHDHIIAVDPLSYRRLRREFKNLFEVYGYEGSLKKPFRGIPYCLGNLDLIRKEFHVSIEKL